MKPARAAALQAQAAQAQTEEVKTQGERLGAVEASLADLHAKLDRFLEGTPLEATLETDESGAVLADLQVKVDQLLAHVGTLTPELISKEVDRVFRKANRQP